MAYIPQKTYYKISVVASSSDTLQACKTLFDAAMVTALAAANLAAVYPPGSDSTNVSASTNSVTTDPVYAFYDGTAYNMVSAVNYFAVNTVV